MEQVPNGLEKRGSFKRGDVYDVEHTNFIRPQTVTMSTSSTTSSPSLLKLHDKVLSIVLCHLSSPIEAYKLACISPQFRVRLSSPFLCNVLAKRFFGTPDLMNTSSSRTISSFNQSYLWFEG
jgi:hypothetical protein